MCATVNVANRPKCQTPKCSNPANRISWKADGSPLWRKWCGQCHNRRTAAKHGLKRIIEITAARAHMSVAEYNNKTHPYRQYRLDYCENRDGRLGFRCRYKIRHLAQLQVDHKNGKPDDNRKANLQTLCANCHTYKTHQSKDYQTPGRKALKCS